MTDLKLTDHSALVTGAASGIGLATARTLARWGANVLVADINDEGASAAAAEIANDGGCAIACQVDITEKASVANAVETAKSQFGDLHIAVNCVGIASSGALLTDMPDDQLERSIDVNIRGLWHCLRAEIPALIESGGGAIVNVASTMGLIASPMSSPYVMSKHAVIGLTKAAALEYSGKGVRVNAVCPGGTDTPMISDDVKRALVPLHPIGRIAQPEEIAAAIAFLVSPAASFITGAALPVDGGWTTH